MTADDSDFQFFEVAMAEQKCADRSVFNALFVFLSAQRSLRPFRNGQDGNFIPTASPFR
jgi:hypothetical protein